MAQVRGKASGYIHNGIVNSVSLSGSESAFVTLKLLSEPFSC